MPYAQLDLDMQLYAIACQVKWHDIDRWPCLILKPGMMHALMSLASTIGYFIKATGGEELIASAFGCIKSILNGKSWTNALRAFRMLIEAVLHDFISDCDVLTHENLQNILMQHGNIPQGS